MVGWVLNLNCLCVPDRPDTRRVNEGARDRKDQGATNPWWLCWQTSPVHSQEVNPPPDSKVGTCGLEGGQPDVADPGVCVQEAVAGPVQEPQSGGREGTPAPALCKDRSR